MTKKLLLAAAAVSAIGFAGAANAQVISSAEVSNKAVRTTGGTPVAVTNTPYGLANESILTNVMQRRTTVSTGDNVVTFGTTGGRLLEFGTTYRVTYTLSGSANPAFAAQVASSALTVSGVDASCVNPISVVTGTGASGSSTVSFLVSTVNTASAACVAAAAPDASSIVGAPVFSLDLPFQIAQLGDVTATVTGAIDASNTNPGANPNRFAAAASVDLVKATAGYRIYADATVDGVTGDGADNADAATRLALGTSGAPFRSFLGTDRVIGAAGFVLAPTTGLEGIYAGMNATPLTAPTYTLSVSATGGDFSVLKPEAGNTDALGTDLTVNANNLSATLGTSTAAVSGGHSIGLKIAGTPTASIAAAPQTYTVTVTPVVPSASDTNVTRPAAITNAPLETVGLEGTTFVAPWVQSTNPNYNTVLRVSNHGNATTGAVQLAINSPLNAVTRSVCTAAELPKLAGVPAGGELAINSADLTTCFGDFGRSDVSLTVLSLSNNLTAKLRIVSPGGAVNEQSLGRFSGTNTPN